MTLHDAILSAKLGRTRKDAQEDTCDVFAAALYDVLRKHGIPCNLRTAAFYLSSFSQPEWHHAIVQVGGRYYDSMGEFSFDVVRKRLKIHPTVKCRIVINDDKRDGFYEEEMDELHAFYVKKLDKAVAAIALDLRSITLESDNDMRSITLESDNDIVDTPKPF